MSIYYIENENGTYFSEDGKRKFIRLEGREAYDYLQHKKDNDIRFLQTTTLDGKEKVFIEIPSDKKHIARDGERHAQYSKNCKKKSGIVTLSIEELSYSRGIKGEELLEDKTANTEQTVVMNLEYENLHKALHTLTPLEYQIINLLYLSNEPMSEEKIGEMLGVSQQRITRKAKN